MALQAVLPAELAHACRIDLADARRLVGLVHRRGVLPARAPATIRRAALEAARAIGHIPALALADRQASRVDPFVKYAFRLQDGSVIESVRIPLERAGRFAACVSSQVGCALACAFCATGRMGLQKNLEAWEIVEQVRMLRADLPEGGRIHGVLFQGMGEPLANVERVVQAIRVLAEPSAQAIDMRNITVCTAGLPAGIRRLAREVPAARLGVSIGSVRAGARATLMPIDRTHSLAEVLAACGEHARTTRLAPMWAYTLLAGHNDGDEDAALLAALAIGFSEEHGIRPRLSLIPYNSQTKSAVAASNSQTKSAAAASNSQTKSAVAASNSQTKSAVAASNSQTKNSMNAAPGKDPFARSPAERLEAFRAVLRARGVGSIVRYSGGGDVSAACGQLATGLEAATAGFVRVE